MHHESYCLFAGLVIQPDTRQGHGRQQEEILPRPSFPRRQSPQQEGEDDRRDDVPRGGQCERADLVPQIAAQDDVRGPGKGGDVDEGYACQGIVSRRFHGPTLS